MDIRNEEQMNMDKKRNKKFETLSKTLKEKDKTSINFAQNDDYEYF